MLFCRKSTQDLTLGIRLPTEEELRAELERERAALSAQTGR